MGNTWEVQAWLPKDESREEYHYVPVWRGESRRQAMKEARKAKDAGAGCVAIYWRG